mgnify:CR=1 FL=1|jgi:hypothetical protein
MKLFQTYANRWSCRIPYELEEKSVKFFIARNPMPVYWTIDKSSLLASERDVVYSDVDIAELPEVGKQSLIRTVFIKGDEL